MAIHQSGRRFLLNLGGLEGGLGAFFFADREESNYKTPHYSIGRRRTPAPQPMTRRSKPRILAGLFAIGHALLRTVA
jgi:hypothetical protein